ALIRRWRCVLNRWRAHNVEALVYIAAFALDEGESIEALRRISSRWPLSRSESRRNPAARKPTHNRLSAKTDPHLDGKLIGYRAMSSDTMNLWVAPICEPAKARAVTKQSGAPVVDYRWTNLSGRVLYRAPARVQAAN